MHITENVNLLEKKKERKQSPMISLTIGSEFRVPGPGRQTDEGAQVLLV